MSAHENSRDVLFSSAISPSVLHLNTDLAGHQHLAFPTSLAREQMLRVGLAPSPDGGSLESGLRWDDEDKEPAGSLQARVTPAHVLTGVKMWGCGHAMWSRHEVSEFVPRDVELEVVVHARAVGADDGPKLLDQELEFV